ncbi:MAG: tripartite tricarboxylate transporter TctB family protein [Burkholderiaceae bacterium]
MSKVRNGGRDPASGHHGWLNRYNKDYYAGALMLLIGLWAVYQGLAYKMGTLSRMGPGFFPVAVGAVLALMGVFIALGARSNVPAGEDKHQVPEWRGWLCIVASMVAFIALGKYGGLLPATFAVVFISALGDRENTLRDAALLSLSVCAVAVVVFWWALKMQFPLFAWG